MTNDNEICIYALRGPSPAGPQRGLLTKSTGFVRTAGSNMQATRTRALFEELDAFILARRPLRKSKKAVLRFGRQSPHSPAMQALVDQLEE